MKIKSIQFSGSSAKINQCPKTELPEYAFAGRSNVGKSSLINMLAGQSRLAKTSSKPGKTQLINHFLVNNSWYLVDLPGYGYARVSKTLKKTFNKLITNYLHTRENLACLFLLIDSRHKPLSNDLEFIRWMGENRIPFALCFTKTDKLGSKEQEKYLDDYKRALLEEWEELPPLFSTSSIAFSGKKELLKFIEETNAVIQENNIQDY